MNQLKVKKISGCAACDLSLRGEEIRLEKLEVSVFYRGAGIGTQMLDRVKAFGKTIQLYPEAEPGRSRDLKRFYRRNGFKPCRDGYWRWVPVMLAVFMILSSAQAAPPPGFAEKMADAIYAAEGGAKTRWPYGVKSIQPPAGTKDKTAWARRITINSANNNWRRWEAAGKRESFVAFMARRWCPPSADPQGHANWIKNVNAILK